MHDNYRSKRKDYHLALSNFLNHLEVDRVKKLCAAAETDEKLFWKLLKSQRFSSQMSAFLVNGAFITEEMTYVICGRTILKYWVPHC